MSEQDQPYPQAQPGPTPAEQAASQGLPTWDTANSSSSYGQSQTPPSMDTVPASAPGPADTAEPATPAEEPEPTSSEFGVGDIVLYTAPTNQEQRAAIVTGTREEGTGDDKHLVYSLLVFPHDGDYAGYNQHTLRLEAVAGDGPGEVQAR